MSFTAPIPEFIPHPLLANPHLMTIAPAFLPRRQAAEFARHGEKRLFPIDEATQVLAHCHWQHNRTEQPTLIILHGLEGSSESSQVLALACKSFACGFNAVRLNLRNCGGSMHLTATLYNGGLSSDLICVARQLKAEGLKEIFAAGFSLGGNITLKAAGELGLQNDNLLSAVAVVSPAIDLEMSVRAIEKPENRIYELWFLHTLKQKIVEKNKLFPELFDLSLLPRVRTLREFDDLYTAPGGGYGRAANYYRQASARTLIKNIRIPALVIASHDDPLVPFEMFQQIELANPHVTLLATAHGGHSGFVHRQSEDEFDRFWAENRVLGFCRQASGLSAMPHV